VVLVELGVVEQRFAAVLEVLGGASVTDVARRYGVVRQTVHRWLRRYGELGVSGLVDGSSKPLSCPHQMPAVVEARVVGLRHGHPGWGPRSIGYQLAQEGVEPLPSRSAIYRALLRHNLITGKRRRKPRSAYRRWERSRAMELWQMDVMGGVRLVAGGEVKVVTGIDDHSRFCVSAMVVARATAKPVCDALAAAMRRHGVPDQVLTDNGKVFTGRFGPGTGEVLFDRILRENGIDHLLTAPRSPTTTGKVERFHKTIRNEFLTGRTFESLSEAQSELDGWVEHYNTLRPHQGIGMVPPVRRFELAVSTPVEPLDPTTVPVEEEEPAQPGVRPRLTRRVGSGGRISLAGHKYHVGRWLAGEVVEVASRNGLVEITHRGVLVASHARLHAADKEPGLWRQPKARKPRPATTGRPVTRKVDGSGSVSFAGTTYRVGNPYRRQQVEVRVVGATVQISHDGNLVRTHRVKHDRDKEHGAFAVARGRPRRVNAAS
jgi:transposase InsO family protein